MKINNFNKYVWLIELLVLLATMGTGMGGCGLGSDNSTTQQCTDPNYPLACTNGTCCPSGYPYDCLDNHSCYTSLPTSCSSYVTCGGGNGSGGGGGSYCYSTSACIPSSLSNTCECSGSTTQTQCVSGHPACSAAGGPCGDGTHACCGGETCIYNSCVQGCGQCTGIGCQ